MTIAIVAKSQVVTDLDATPVVKSNQIKKGGRVRSAYGFVPSTSVLLTTVGQTYPLVRIPARARITDLKLSYAACGNGAVTLDLFRAANVDSAETQITTGGALNAGAALGSAAVNASNYTAPAIADKAKDLATQFVTAIGTAGATGDGEFDIAVTVSTVSTGAAVAIGMEVEYVLPE